MHGDTTIAIQGARGSFHQEAAEHVLQGASIVACQTFQEVFESVAAEKTTHGLVAIENSLHGSINPVYRLLERHNLSIVGETLLKIAQQLIASVPMDVATLNNANTKVLSQAPALAQCELWLDAHLPLAKRIETHDTADSVRKIVEEGDPSQLAIAGKSAVDTYGGTIVAGPINDDPNNFTRFILLQKDFSEPKGANRTSIILTSNDTPGALYHALGVFVDNGINLSKIDSYPIPNGTRRYAFYIDFDAALSSPQARNTIEILKALGCSGKVLGSYKADTAGRDACSL